MPGGLGGPPSVREPTGGYGTLSRDEARQARARSRPVIDPAEPLIGREAICAHLERSLDRVCEGEKRATAIIGPAGSGKTTLARWAEAVGRSRGLLVAAVRTPAAGRSPSRFPMRELFAGLRTACIDAGFGWDVTGEQLAGLEAEASHGSMHALAAVLADVSRRAPLAFVVDDAHDAPAEGVETLVATLKVSDARAALLVTGRADHDALAPSADLWVDRLAVAPLTPDATAAIAQRIFGKPLLPSTVEALHTRALGNPLFVVETLREWLDDEDVVVIGGHISLRSEANARSPKTLQDLIAAQLARGGQGWAMVVGAVALLGRPASFDELREVCQIESEPLVVVLDRLIESELLVGEGSPASFRLPFPTHEAVVASAIGPVLCGLLHARILEMLRPRCGVSATALARHAVETLDPPEDLAALVAAAAHEAEAARSYREAARWYGTLATLDASDADRAEALLGQARATDNFDPAAASALCTSALGARMTPATRARLLLARARALRKVGDFDAAAADLQAALPLATVDDTYEIRHAVAVLEAIHGHRARAEASLRDLAAETLGRPAHAKAIGHLSHLLFVKGSLLEARDLCAQAYAACTDGAYGAYLRGNLGWMQTLLGEWDEAESLLAEAMREAEAGDDAWNADSVLASAGYLFAWRGDLPRALDLAARSVAHSRRLGNPGALVSALDSFMIALLEDGRAAEASRAFREAQALVTDEMEPRELSLSFVVAGEAFLLAGDEAAAREVAAPARAALAEAACWLIAVDRLEAQIALAAESHRRALAFCEPWLASPSPMAYEQARLIEVAARATVASGDRGGGLVLGVEALSRYARLGAKVRERKVRAWLERAQPRPRGRPRSRMAHGLTEREIDVLRLVARGRSNAEIAESLTLSTATVKKHVEHILAKTGCARRGELAGLMAQLGVD